MLITYYNSHVKNVDWVYQTNLSISNRLQPQNPLQPAPSPRGGASRSPYVGCVRYARTRSPFSLQPQPTACVPCGTHPTDGFKGHLKNARGVCSICLAIKNYLKNSCY